MNERIISRVLVVGLGRCGSSLTMQMLAAGGMPVHGKAPTYEVEEAMVGRMDRAWLAAQRGAIKVLEPKRMPSLVLDHPGNAIIWLDRDPDQQAKSQAKFLHLVADTPKLSRKAVRGLAASIRTDASAARSWLARAKVPVLRLTFEDLVAAPEWAATTIARFVWPSYDLNGSTMARVVRPRGPECLPNLLELELL